ncbi:MAG: DUF6391 domain-containing protein [Chloroflexi bacterium]|nr:DUF6391 domain-containing protein [Chloroflexota bacterium]MDA1175136.1 DUF6391 domain-containing protein [Chloroflexota bacterium]
MHFWEKTKRNHGLEHGTISLLLSRMPHDQPMAGYSIPGGFFVVGDLTTEQIRETSSEALSRMQAGEADLAISPFCGTNIVVGAALATAGTLLGYRLGGRGMRGVNRAFSNAALAIVASRPVGRTVQQKYTTSADVGTMSVVDITRYQLGKVTIHWVSTAL